MGGLFWSHGKQIPDGEKCDLGMIDLPDQSHVTKHAGVSGVVKAKVILELDHEP